MSTKNSNSTIGNRTRDLPTCSAVPQPVTLPRAPLNEQSISETIFCTVKAKVKVTLVQALRLCTGRTAHRGSRGIALLFHDQRH